MAVLLLYAAKLSTMPNKVKHMKQRRIVVTSLIGLVFMLLMPILKLSLIGNRDLISLNGAWVKLLIALSSVVAKVSILPSSHIWEALFTFKLTLLSRDKKASSLSRHELIRIMSFEVNW